MNNLKHTQHFLNDPTIAKKMITQAHVTANDMVIDIGAGKGALTNPLSQRAGRIIAVELDTNLAMLLKKIIRHSSGCKSTQYKLFRYAAAP